MIGKPAKALFDSQGTIGESPPSPWILFCNVRSQIRVVITSFYWSKWSGFLKADRLAEVISAVMSIVMVVGGWRFFHLDYCLVTAAVPLPQEASLL